jgi:hypothetical protein
VINIFYDTEFVEDQHGIELLSIGMVAQYPDGRLIDELYLVRDLNPILHARAGQNPFLVEQVLPEIEAANNAGQSVSTREIPNLVSGFVLDTLNQAYQRRFYCDEVSWKPCRKDVHLWAYYAAYDHVVLARLFGTMVQLPDHMPMHTCDLRQEMDRLGVCRDQLPANPCAHNALADAQWCAKAFQVLREQGVDR